MSHPAGLRDHAFRTLTDTRSYFTPAPIFRTNPTVPFNALKIQQARLEEQLGHLNDVVARYSKPRKNRTPAREAADKETHGLFSTASESVDKILRRLQTTFPDEGAWSEADKADMPSSVDLVIKLGVKEGFIKTFQASLIDSLVELHKKVKELVQDPTLELAEENFVRII